MTPAFQPGAHATPDERGWRVTLPGGLRTLHVAISGPPEGPLVVFEPDAFGCAADFGWLQQALAPDVRSLAYDHAGLGLSDAAPGPQDMAAAAEDLETLLQAVAHDGPVVIVAFGQGACLAQLLATRGKAKVAGLVLVDGLTASAMLDPAGVGVQRVRRAASAVMPAAARIGLMAALAPISGDPIGLPDDAAAERRRVMSDHRHYAAAAEAQVHWRAHAEQVRDAGEPDRELPVAVISTARPDSALNRLQVEPARRSRRGWTCDGAGHSAADLLGPRCGHMTLQAIRHVLQSID